MVERAEFSTEEKTAPEGHAEKMAEKYESQTDSSGEAAATPPTEGTKDDAATDASKASEKGDSEGGDKDSAKASEKGDDKGGDKEGEQSEPDTKDFARYREEYAEKGELSDETYAELQEKYNLPKEVVDDYVQSQAARAEAVEQAGYAVAGSKEQFSTMAQWAKQNLPESEIQEFNRGVNSGDVTTAIEAVNSLKSKYVDAVGQEPRLIEGQGQSASAPGYQSRAELTADMRDTRYRKDPAFRAEVERKLRNSTVI